MLLATIEHSGTFATLHKLDRQPWPMSKAERMPAGHVIVTHLWDDEMPRIRALAQRMPLVTTRRAESAIRASWLRRGKDLTALDRQLANYRTLLTLNPVIHEVDR